MTLKKLRQSLEWTQKQMATYLRCTEAQICHLEKGKRKLNNYQKDLLKVLEPYPLSVEEKIDALYRVICFLFSTPDNHEQIKNAWLGKDVIN